MDTEEFRAWLNELAEGEHLVDGALDELAAQRDRFDERRDEIQAEYHGHFVGIYRGELVVARTRDELYALTDRPWGGALYYEFIPSPYSLPEVQPWGQTL